MLGLIAEIVLRLQANYLFTQVFGLTGNDGRRPDHKIQQIPANLRINDCRSNIDHVQ